MFYQDMERDQSHEMVNPFTTKVPHHIETSQLIYDTNQLTGFYMTGNIGC